MAGGLYLKKPAEIGFSSSTAAWTWVRVDVPLEATSPRKAFSLAMRGGWKVV
jgi:hypothetical protein